MVELLSGFDELVFGTQGGCSWDSPDSGLFLFDAFGVGELACSDQADVCQEGLVGRLSCLWA